MSEAPPIQCQNIIPHKSTNPSKLITSIDDATSESQTKLLSVTQSPSKQQKNNKKNKNCNEPFVLLVPKTMNDIKHQRRIYWVSNQAFIGKANKKMPAISIVNKYLSIV